MASGAAVYKTIDELPTPALVVDLDALEANIVRMASVVRNAGRALRPHAKTHKCPAIARRLIDAGAAGSCTAKLSEAEVFAAEDVAGLLVTTPVVGKEKIRRAIVLAARSPDTMYCVDNQENARDLNDAARAAGVTVNVLLDLLVGGRGGIEPGRPAVEMAECIDGLPNLHLAGIQAYVGPASHRAGFEERKRLSRESMAPAIETRRSLRVAGIDCPLLTGGSTGTYNIDLEIDGLTELQPGSFLFMDLDYRRIGGQDGPLYCDFQNALFVVSTVVSKPARQTAIVDAGVKAFSTDRPLLPEPVGRSGISYTWAGDEHGRLTLDGAACEMRVGDRITFVAPHCDPTVNLYDRMYGVRNGIVEEVFRISARGMSQ